MGKHGKTWGSLGQYRVEIFLIWDINLYQENSGKTGEIIQESWKSWGDLGKHAGNNENIGETWGNLGLAGVKPDVFFSDWQIGKVGESWGNLDGHEKTWGDLGIFWGHSNGVSSKLMNSSLYSKFGGKWGASSKCSRKIMGNRGEIWGTAGTAKMPKIFPGHWGFTGLHRAPQGSTGHQKFRGWEGGGSVYRHGAWNVYSIF